MSNSQLVMPRPVNVALLDGYDVILLHNVEDVLLEQGIKVINKEVLTPYHLGTLLKENTRKFTNIYKLTFFDSTAYISQIFKIGETYKKNDMHIQHRRIMQIENLFYNSKIEYESLKRLRKFGLMGTSVIEKGLFSTPFIENRNDRPYALTFIIETDKPINNLQSYINLTTNAVKLYDEAMEEHMKDELVVKYDITVGELINSAVGRDLTKMVELVDKNKYKENANQLLMTYINENTN